ncbi:MAG: type II toxin-antitoxin system RelE/ParE family toxin [Actinobacteria bacterium]|nr:type II toxin-antitoxin system RelE/ParE family toxin [Actinomycetota bacterium]
MQYQVIVSERALRDLEGIPPRIVPAIIEFIYGDLAKAPLRVGQPLMRELNGYLGARRGSYRVLFAINGETINIARIAHRADVYR